MYGSQAVKLRSADRSVGTSGIGEVLAIYFPELVLSAKGERFHLTDSLMLFSSSPSGAVLLSQGLTERGQVKLLKLGGLDLNWCSVTIACVFYLSISWSFWKMLFFELLEDQKKPKEALLCMSAAVHMVNLSIAVFIPKGRKRLAWKFLRDLYWKKVLMDREDVDLSDDVFKVNI